jgi:hypothetical protein
MVLPFIASKEETALGKQNADTAEGRLISVPDFAALNPATLLEASGRPWAAGAAARIAVFSGAAECAGFGCARYPTLATIAGRAAPANRIIFERVGHAEADGRAAATGPAGSHCERRSTKYQQRKECRGACLHHAILPRSLMRGAVSGVRSVRSLLGNVGDYMGFAHQMQLATL